MNFFSDNRPRNAGGTLQIANGTFALPYISLKPIGSGNVDAFVMLPSPQGGFRHSHVTLRAESINLLLADYEADPEAVLTSIFGYNPALTGEYEASSRSKAAPVAATACTIDISAVDF